MPSLNQTSAPSRSETANPISLRRPGSDGLKPPSGRPAEAADSGFALPAGEADAGAAGEVWVPVQPAVAAAAAPAKPAGGTGPIALAGALGAQMALQAGGLSAGESADSSAGGTPPASIAAGPAGAASLADLTLLSPNVAAAAGPQPEEPNTTPLGPPQAPVAAAAKPAAPSTLPALDGAPESLSAPPPASAIGAVPSASMAGAPTTTAALHAEAAAAGSSGEDDGTAPDSEEPANGTPDGPSAAGAAVVPVLVLAPPIHLEGSAGSAAASGIPTAVSPPELRATGGPEGAAAAADSTPVAGAGAPSTTARTGEAAEAAPAEGNARKVDPGPAPETPAARSAGEGLSFGTQLARADVPGRGDAPSAPGPAASAGPQGPVVERLPVANVPVEIGLRSLAGVRSFEIRLAPQELGRIDVQLDFHDEGRVDARLVVDRPETLAYLQRDAGQLHRALEQAGFRPSDTGVALSLRQDGADAGAGNRSQMGDGQGERPQSGSSRYGGTSSPEPVPDAPPAQAVWARASGVDLRI
jgi:flagellar hook-length control protein FliK